MLCPTRCGDSLLFISTGVICRCGFSLDSARGILDFVGCGSGTVGAKAGSDSSTDRRTFQQLTQILHDIGKYQIPVAVEFSAGNGAWTAGMDRSERFGEVFTIADPRGCRSLCSEIPSKPGTHLVCQSAKELDFEAGSVDLVAGRSFLRHFADYEALLAKCARWLKPDGAAIFLEPCIQGKIWIAFLIKLVIEFESQPTARRWDLIRHTLEGLYRKDLEPTQSSEDIWSFDVDMLRDTAREAGFSAVDVVDDDEQLLRSFKRAIFGVIRDCSNRAPRYDAMLEAFGDTFANFAPRTLVSPMVFFVFRKSVPPRRHVAQDRKLSSIVSRST